MNWLRQTLRAFLGIRPRESRTGLREVMVAGAWTVHDRDGLRSFLASDLGRKLINRMRATEYAVATAGAADKFHTAHSAGLTVGYGSAIKHLISLSYSADAQAEKPNDSGGQGEARPIEPEQDEILARYSP